MITVKNLAAGALPAAVGVLYTVPVGATAIVMDIALTPTGASGAAGIYFRKSGGSLRGLASDALTLAADTHFQRRGRLTMGAGDTIEGYAVNGGDFVISGVERT